MIIVTNAPLLLLLLFVAGLAFAAVEDGYRRRVSNVAVAMVGLSGIAAFIMTGHAPRLWEPLVIAAVVLAIGTFLFSRGLMGGGDIKLMAAGCFWFSLRGQAIYLAAALIAGGVLAILVLAYRWLRSRGGFKRLGSTSIGIPYAMAIAAGAGWTVWHYRLG